MHLQLPASATEINLKRLIAAQDGAERDQTRDPATHATATTCLTGRLVRVIDDITRLVVAESSTAT